MSTAPWAQELLDALTSNLGIACIAVVLIALIIWALIARRPW